MITKHKNTTIYYTDNGDNTKDTIVLLHGFLETVSIWDFLIPEFEATHRIICIDLLGHGNTDNPEGIHTMELHAETVKAVLDDLTVTNALVIGHSMGGYVTLAIAELFPKLVNGLCLVNSTSIADSDERKKARDRVVDLVKRSHKTYASMSIANLFNPEKRDEFANAIDSLKDKAYSMSAESMIASTLGMKHRKDRSETLTNFKGKKRIIAGEKDPVLDITISIEESKETQTELNTLPDGHMSYIENKNELIAALKAFVEKEN